MRFWGKLIAAALAPLLLTGCLWGPGKFKSDLALHKDGSFVLDYRGEIMIQIPDDKTPPGPWSDDMAICNADGSMEADGGSVSVSLEPQADADDGTSEDGSEERPCTAAEMARIKAEYERKSAEKREEQRKEADQMAKLFGIPGMDDDSNRLFAAKLMKYQGWRSVTYKGKGLFDVDYHLEGRLTQDYAFPMMPDSDMLIPFIMLRRRADGTVMVTAPALTGGKGPFGARAKMLGLPDKGNDGPPSRAEGRFTVTTDGEILTNNSEDGPTVAPGGRQVHWDVGPGSDRIPEMLVKL